MTEFAFTEAELAGFRDRVAAAVQDSLSPKETSLLLAMVDVASRAIYLEQLAGNPAFAEEFRQSLTPGRADAILSKASGLTERPTAGDSAAIIGHPDIITCPKPSPGSPDDDL